jgi:hypothetical protein
LKTVSKELFDNVRQRFTTTAPLSGNPRFRDLTNLFDDSPEPVFIDTCHFSEEENLTVAREIAKDLAPVLNARTTTSAQ